MQEITFETLNPWTLSDVARRRDRIAMRGRGRLFLPPGAAGGPPRPAVVVLEGLGGIIPERELRYAAMLSRQGYVTLAVDTFGPRGAAGLSHPLRALRVTETAMVADAFGALRWLAAQPFVDAQRIAVMGFSYGAMVSVFTAYRQIAELYAPGGPHFAAHAAYYGCTVARFADPTTTGAPLRLFLGGKDENICLERTRAIVADLRRGGSDARLHLYPDAYHQWDSKDRTPRFTRWSLKRYAFLVEPGNRVRDTRTRLRMRGPLSRAAMLLANMDPSGYTMLRDERVLARSDRELLGFLSQALGPLPHPARGAPLPDDDAAAGESGMRQTAG